MASILCFLLIGFFGSNKRLYFHNFKNLSVTTNGSTKNYSNGNQDKGFRGELIAFTNAVSMGGAGLIDENEFFETSSATLAVLESLQTGLTIKL